MVEKSQELAETTRDVVVSSVLQERAQAVQEGAATLQGDLSALRGKQDRLEEARLLGAAARGDHPFDHRVLKSILAVLSRHEEAIQLIADGLHEDAMRALLGTR